MMNNANHRPEIVAPAGNLEKLKMAVLYGADAVYFGGDQLNLRVQADNFTLDDLNEALNFCKTHGAKAIFLLNSFLHEKDIPAARRYIESIKGLPFDAIMISDPGMMALIKDAGINSSVHLSTQMSTLNHLAVRFWTKAGIDRIVLARETTVDEIKMIKDATGAEMEIFVHGALCVAYSGRCLLSRYLSGRDANQGDCAQSCRWRYSLVEETRPGAPLDIIENEAGTEIISSKDLCLIEQVQKYIDAGVDAFKIEGRMKSLYYTANTARIYRHAVKLAGTDEFTKHLPFFKEELDLISHRPYTDDLFNEFDGSGFASISYIKKTLFLGYKTGNTPDKDGSMIKAFNPFHKNETVDVIFPILDRILDGSFTVKEIFDVNNNNVDMARPGGIYRIIFDRDMSDNAILRRRC